MKANILEMQEAADEIERLRAALTEIHAVSQKHLLPAWQVIESIAGIAKHALTDREGRELTREEDDLVRQALLTGRLSGSE